MIAWYDDIDAATLQRIKTYSAFNDPESKNLMVQTMYEYRQEEIAELKEKLKTAYRKGMRHIAKALKDYDKTDGAWTDYFEHTVDKVLQREQLDFEEYGTLADQLTKAKELLKQWLQTSKASDCDNINIVTDTEQFLSEVEKC